MSAPATARRTSRPAARTSGRSRARRRFAADEQGATVLEFALAATLFFMTLFGTIEFGRAVWQYNMMSDLALEGARWASVQGAGNSAACTTATQAACKASVAQIQDYVRSRAPGSSAYAPPSKTMLRALGHRSGARHSERPTTAWCPI